MSGSLASSVRMAREQRGLSQAGLAELVGTTQQTIDRIERGETSFSRCLDALKRTLQIDVAEQEASILARRIRERLDALNLSANAASLNAGMSRDAVRMILDGRSASPRYETIKRLSEVLECSPEYLTGADDPTDADDQVAAPITSAPSRDGDILRQAATVLRSYGRDATARELDDLARIIAKAQERAGG